jgi:hypothetical protein
MEKRDNHERKREKRKNRYREREITTKYTKYTKKEL